MNKGDRIIWTKWTKSGTIWNFKKFSGTIVSIEAKTTQVLPDGKKRPIRVLSTKLTLEADDTPLSLVDVAHKAIATH